MTAGERRAGEEEGGGPQGSANRIQCLVSHRWGSVRENEGLGEA